MVGEDTDATGETFVGASRDISFLVAGSVRQEGILISPQVGFQDSANVGMKDRSSR